METEQPTQPDEEEQIEGLDSEGRSWGDYPLDEMLIRSDNRTIHDVTRRIEQGRYVMDPDFQRDFIARRSGAGRGQAQSVPSRL